MGALLIFIDTSVLVAILAEEEDAPEWSARVEEPHRRFTSGLVILEAAMRLSTKLLVEPHEAEAAITAFLREAEVEVLPIGEAEATAAIDAFAAYGKGRGHPAKLNLSDCMSYACARTKNLSLLYKGSDFAQTDLG